MRNFLRVVEGVDTMPVLTALRMKPWLWNLNRFRTTFPNTPHAEVDDIHLRFSDTNASTTTGRVMGDTAPVWSTVSASLEGRQVALMTIKELPQVQPIATALMARVKGYSLERMLITRLAPGKRILPHADDEGSYVHAQGVARYHVCLQGEAGCTFRAGEEIAHMRTGEIWWFNAHAEHEVVNNSAADRLHLLVDMRVWP